MLMVADREVNMDKNKGYFLPKPDFNLLYLALESQYVQVLGMTEYQGALDYRPIASVEALPKGRQDEQALGTYRLRASESDRYFGWANGPSSLKPLLFQPKETLWLAETDATGRVKIEEPVVEVKPTAVIGVRSCDLAALSMLDQHFLTGKYSDPSYQIRRQNLFIVAVNCSHPSDQCFCASTGDGPHVQGGYDLLLTELDDGFIAKAGSDQGSKLIGLLDSTLEPLTEKHKHQALEQLNQAIRVQKKRLPENNLSQTLLSNWDSKAWDRVAEQCLACGNCTSVCPTCFCHREEDVALNLNGQVEHQRLWDSCFGDEHGYMVGHQVRPKIKDRYRQWMTHKLGGWHEQFGRSGCVGCGRCSTWCPAQIDFVDVVNQVTGGDQ